MVNKTAIRQTFAAHLEGRTGYASICEGVGQATKWFIESIDKKELPPRQHLLELMEQILAPPESPLYKKYGTGAVEASLNNNIKDVAEAVAASGDFNNLFTKMIHAQFIPAYDAQLSVIESLVTRLPSDNMIQYHGGIDDNDEPERTPELEYFPEGTPREKYVQIQNDVVGKLIPVSKQTLLFDKTGGALMDRIVNQGDNMGRFIRRYVIKRVQDLAFSTNQFSLSADTALTIGGSTRAIYAADHSAWDNGQANSNVVTTTSGDITPAFMQTGFDRLANMKNIFGRILNLTGTTLLINSAKAFDGDSLINSPGRFDSTELSSNPIKGLGIVQNLVFDAEVTANTYYWGDFKKQFVLQEVEPLTSQNIGSDLKRNVIMQHLAQWHGGVGARDYRWVVKFS